MAKKREEETFRKCKWQRKGKKLSGEKKEKEKEEEEKVGSRIRRRLSAN